MSGSTRLLAIASIAAFTLCLRLPAQAVRRFEAVSIKPNRSGAEASDTTTTPGRITLINVTPISLIRRAFGIQDSQIIGASNWLMTERFDLIAVTGGPESLSDRERQSFFQTLLADRFGFKHHEEIRELRAYTLVIGKKGTKLFPSTSTGEYAMKLTAESGRQILRSTKGNIPRLVEILSRVTGRTVTDQTGLSAQYDFTLEWSPDHEGAETGPSLFTAVQEQLGLRLEPAKVPTRVIVIDAFERPSVN